MILFLLFALVDSFFFFQISSRPTDEYSGRSCSACNSRSATNIFVYIGTAVVYITQVNTFAPSPPVGNERGGGGGQGFVCVCVGWGRGPLVIRPTTTATTCECVKRNFGFKKKLRVCVCV